MTELSELRDLLLATYNTKSNSFLEFKRTVGKRACLAFSKRDRDEKLPKLLKKTIGYEYVGNAVGGLAGRVEALSARQAAPNDVAFALYLLFLKLPEFHHHVAKIEEALFGVDHSTGKIKTIKSVLDWEPQKLVAENPACLWRLYPVEAKAVLREICSFSLFDRQPPRTGGDVAIFLEVSALSTPDENGRRYGFGELVVRLLFTGADVSSIEYNSWFNRERILEEGKFAKLRGSGSDASMRLRSEPGYLDGRYEILEQGHFLKIRSIENKIEFQAQLEFNKREKSLVYADGESLASDTKTALISIIESEQYGESNHLLGWLVLNVHKYQIKPVREQVGV